MDQAEFHRLAEPVLRRTAAADAEHGLGLVYGRTATAAEIAAVERAMGVVLPEQYKAFMTQYGGGIFGFLELFPVVARPHEYRDNLRTVNDAEFPDRTFVAVAVVGTGDHWGFPVTGGRCHDQVWFHFHDDANHEPVAGDFLEFVARHGMRSA
ncbi:SMI1/KNR4 family protein [Dactylosporangium sp. NPDC050688]|uniref:SMI1/KNR4 family protein n=1 Tax=Dactylosporangium sp. NPDC050688 TaxID=3157217 RepID=UPI0033DE3DEA